MIYGWMAMLLFLNPAPSHAGLVLIKIKPHSETGGAQEREGYRYANAIIDMLAHTYNAETYTDAIAQKYGRGSSSKSDDISLVETMTDEMTALKQSNEQIQEAISLISPFNKSKRWEINQATHLIITSLRRVIGKQKGAIQECKSLLNSKPENFDLGQKVDSITSIGASLHAEWNFYAQEISASAYGMLNPPLAPKGNYEGFNMTSAQRAELSKTLETYFGENVKTIHEGTLFSELGAAGLYKFLNQQEPANN